jgi:hypothetical protein
MAKRIAGSAGLVLALLLAGAGQGQEGMKPVWKHGFSFPVRVAGEEKFSEKTKKFGTEVFLDPNLKQLVYVSETGSLGLGQAGMVAPGPDVKPPSFFLAFEVQVRRAGEDKFTDKTQKFNVEVRKDENAGNLEYMCQTGALAVMPAGALSAPAEIKDPTWSHAMEVKVRPAGEKDYDKAKKYSIEVYKDENTNQLVYISETGSVALVPAGGPPPKEIKNPVWFEAFEAAVRKGKEKEFTKDTKKYGLEVYKDENANTLIYVTETGDIAVVPAGSVT